MKITLDIPESAQKTFKENLVESDSPKVLEAVITHYLKDALMREDLDEYSAQYLDGLEESGELEDILYEVTLEE